METLNIYLTKEQKQQVDKLKVKYQLSLTTIVDVLVEITWDCLILNCDNELTTRFKEKHIYPLTQKTSIKMPKYLKNKYLEHPNRFANNCLQMYLRHEPTIFLKKDVVEGKHQYWNRIEKELTKRTDNWWKYNEYIRYQSRMNKGKQ